MRFLWFNVETKKELRAKISNLEAMILKLEDENNSIRKYNEDIADAYEDMRSRFPFDIGQAVYDIQLRGENGRYTRTKASREHSLINKVTVTSRNYFKLKTRMLKHDVFKTREEARKYLDNVCIK